MAAPLTEAAIAKVRDLIRNGELRPGQRLPAEAELSVQLGISRGGTREAVRALATVGVLDVRRGNGTFVTALTPDQLFIGISDAVDLMSEESLLELMECRRVVEPQVTALAARRARPEDLAAIAKHLALMEAADDEQERTAHDADFHAAVAAASGNSAMAAILRGISGVTMRARVWRALSEADASRQTIAEHAAIYVAVRDGDAERASAAALLHVANVEQWMRQAVSDGTEGLSSPPER